VRDHVAVELHAVAVGIAEIHAARNVVLDGGLDGDAELAELAVRGLQLGEAADLPRHVMQARLLAVGRLTGGQLEERELVVFPAEAEEHRAVLQVLVRDLETERARVEVPGCAGVTNLEQPDDCAAIVTRAVRAFGRLDVLLNNAGVGTMVVGGTVESITLEHWDLAQDVNVRAIYLVSRAAVPHMRSTGGAIVNIASVSAFRGSVERPSHAYAASKGAVLALTRAMAASYGRDGIRVNAICPGTIRTRLTADIVDRVDRAAREGHGIPLGP